MLEFTLNTVNVEYSRLLIVTRYYKREDRGTSKMVFIFNTPSFVPMGIIAQLKKKPEFIQFIKSKMIEAIRALSYEDFCTIRDSINGCHAMQVAERYSRFGNNALKMQYTNSEGDAGEHTVAFIDTLEGWSTRIETLDDLVTAVSRITYNSIRK